MAAITNVQAVKFSNERIRPMADLLYTNYLTCKSIVNQWNAQAVSSVITNTADNIVDGSAQDGRSPITGAQATAIITRAQEVITDYEANTNAKLNTVALVEVNGTARF